MKSLFFCCFVLSFIACATPDGAGVAVDSAAAPAVSADAAPSAAPSAVPVVSAESVPSAAPSVSASAEAVPAAK